MNLPLLLTIFKDNGNSSRDVEATGNMKITAKNGVLPSLHTSHEQSHDSNTMMSNMNSRPDQQFIHSKSISANSQSTNIPTQMCHTNVSQDQDALPVKPDYPGKI